MFFEFKIRVSNNILGNNFLKRWKHENIYLFKFKTNKNNKEFLYIPYNYIRKCGNVAETRMSVEDIYIYE